MYIHDCRHVLIYNMYIHDCKCVLKYNMCIHDCRHVLTCIYNVHIHDCRRVLIYNMYIYDCRHVWLRMRMRKTPPRKLSHSYTSSPQGRVLKAMALMLPDWQTYQKR